MLAPAAWAAGVARDLSERIAARPELRLCLPTGDTPSPVYAALPEALDRAGAPWSAVTVVALDEWVGLAPDDAARCDGRLRRELLDRLDPPARFHPIRVDDLAAQAAAAAHDAVLAEGLDLAVVGLGMNGHVGFNEPGSTPDSPTRVVLLDAATRDAAVDRYGAGRRPTAGITVGLARLLAAGEVWLLATGRQKAPVLARALEGAEGPDCPASYLRRHPGLRVLADEPAAALLRGASARARPEPDRAIGAV